jgi:hypothetical protein
MARGIAWRIILYLLRCNGRLRPVRRPQNNRRHGLNHRSNLRRNRSALGFGNGSLVVPRSWVIALIGIALGAWLRAVFAAPAVVIAEHAALCGIWAARVASW